MSKPYGYVIRGGSNKYRSGGGGWTEDLYEACIYKKPGVYGTSKHPTYEAILINRDGLLVEIKRQYDAESTIKAAIDEWRDEARHYAGTGHYGSAGYSYKGMYLCQKWLAGGE